MTCLDFALVWSKSGVDDCSYEKGVTHAKRWSLIRNGGRLALTRALQQLVDLILHQLLGLDNHGW